MHLIIPEGAGAVYFEITKHAGLRINGDIEGAPEPKRRYVNRHLPAMHLAGDEHGKGGDLQGLKIKITIGADLPFFR